MKPTDKEIIDYYRTHSKPQCCEDLGITLSDINTTLRRTNFSKVDAVKNGKAIDPRGEWFERNRKALTKELMTRLWPTWTIIGICRKYHVTEETVRKAADKYGLPPKAPKKAKQEAMKSKAKQNQTMQVIKFPHKIGQTVLVNAEMIDLQGNISRHSKQGKVCYIAKECFGIQFENYLESFQIKSLYHDRGTNIRVIERMEA